MSAWLRGAFNPRELAALAFLSSSLAVGVIVTVIERSDPERFGDFRVIQGAVSPPALPAARAPGLVNLNSASAADLELLPFVGPVTAARIVAYRDRHGAFSSLAELVRVQGIGSRTVSRLEPHVVLGPTSVSR